MTIESAAAPPFMKNGFVVGCERTRQAIYIDPGDEVQDLLDYIERDTGGDHPVSACFHRRRGIGVNHNGAIGVLVAKS